MCVCVWVHLVLIAVLFWNFIFFLKNWSYSFVFSLFAFPTRLILAHKIGQTPNQFLPGFGHQVASTLLSGVNHQCVSTGAERKLLPLPSYSWWFCRQCKCGLKAIETAVFCPSYLKHWDVCVYQVVSLSRVLRLWGREFCRKNHRTDVLRQSWSMQKVRRILQKAQFQSQLR